MAWSNFLITLSTTTHVTWSSDCFSYQNNQLTVLLVRAVGVGSIAYLMKKDVKTGSNMLRQNLKTIRGWLEEQSSTAARWAASESRSIERGRYLTKSLSMFASAPQKRRSSMWRASSNHIQPRRSHRGEQYSHICSHLFVLSCLLYNEMCCALNHAFQLWPVASCVVLTLVFCVEQTKLANETAVSLAKFHCCQNSNQHPHC